MDHHSRAEQNLNQSITPIYVDNYNSFIDLFSFFLIRAGFMTTAVETNMIYWSPLEKARLGQKRELKNHKNKFELNNFLANLETNLNDRLVQIITTCTMYIFQS